MNLIKNTLFIAGLATVLTARSADLMVAPGGSGNIHPTISSAIAAANNGDRILIVPAVYSGNITINKNLTLLSNSANQRYTVSGNVLLSIPAGQTKLTISSMWLTGELTHNMNSVTGAIRMIDCVVAGQVSLGGLNDLTSYLHRDSLLSVVSLCNGVVTGCHLTGTNSPNGVIFDMAVNVVGGSLRFIGNVVGRGTTTTTGTRVWLDPRGPIEVRNNLFVTNTATYTSPFVYFENSNMGPTSTPCVFENNTMIHAGTGNPTFVQVVNTWPALLLSIRNNFFVGSVQPLLTSGTSTMVAYNVASLSLTQVNQTTGAPSPGSPAINAGDPDASFTDLDLSRNDAGCYGGSYSRDNFDDPMTTAATVLFLEAPRRTQAAWGMQLKADGFDR